MVSKTPGMSTPINPLKPIAQTSGPDKKESVDLKKGELPKMGEVGSELKKAKHSTRNAIITLIGGALIGAGVLGLVLSMGSLGALALVGGLLGLGVGLGVTGVGIRLKGKEEGGIGVLKGFAWASLGALLGFTIPISWLLSPLLRLMPTGGGGGSRSQE